jgi:hypothetical protein
MTTPDWTTCTVGDVVHAYHLPCKGVFIVPQEHDCRATPSSSPAPGASPVHDCSDPMRCTICSPVAGAHFAASPPVGGAPELLAQRFHEAYERLAPSFGYETRKASAKPWAEVPENNRRLMTAVCAELFPPRTPVEADAPAEATPFDLDERARQRHE